MTLCKMMKQVSKPTLTLHLIYFLFANELVCVNITAKIRDELLGCKICDNTSNIILTTIYSEG
jgi:hypothetical protein